MKIAMALLRVRRYREYNQQARAQPDEGYIGQISTRPFFRVALIRRILRMTVQDGDRGVYRFSWQFIRQRGCAV